MQETLMQEKAFHIPVLAIVGVGLIGGSLAAALKKAQVTDHVLGVGREGETLKEALHLGLIDEVVSLEQAAAQADVIVLATPISAIADRLQQMEPHLRAHTVLTDVGSTKKEVVQQARTVL